MKLKNLLSEVDYFANPPRRPRKELKSSQESMELLKESLEALKKSVYKGDAVISTVIENLEKIIKYEEDWNKKMSRPLGGRPYGQ